MHLFGFKMTPAIKKHELASLRRAKFYYQEKNRPDFVAVLEEAEHLFRLQLDFTEVNDAADEMLQENRAIGEKDITPLLKVNKKISSFDVSNGTARTFFQAVMKLQSIAKTP